MNVPHLVVVFDLTEAGFKDWWFAASGLIFVAVGFVLVRFPQPVMQLFMWSTRPKFFKVFSWFCLGFSIFWTVLAFAGTYGAYLFIRSAYLDGDYKVVEGTVENFHPMPETGHSDESFTVAGKRFSYSDYSITPGFNNARSHGGPIDEGVRVRIAYVGGTIVRLEVEEAAVKKAESKPIASIWPPTMSKDFPPKGSDADIVFRYFSMLPAFVVLAIAGRWRWRGKRYIAQDPSLRAGYNRMTLGLCLWGGTPILAGAIVSVVGHTPFLVFPNSLTGHGSSSARTFGPLTVGILWGVVIAKWVYWTFFQNGAAKLARHPGLIDHEWVAKVWPSFAALGYLVSVVPAFVQLA